MPWPLKPGQPFIANEIKENIWGNIFCHEEVRGRDGSRCTSWENERAKIVRNDTNIKRVGLSSRTLATLCGTTVKGSQDQPASTTDPPRVGALPRALGLDPGLAS